MKDSNCREDALEGGRIYVYVTERTLEAEINRCQVWRMTMNYVVQCRICVKLQRCDEMVPAGMLGAMANACEPRS